MNLNSNDHIHVLLIIIPNETQMTSCRCACEEPRDPSNETLQFWEERNITPSQVNWTMLEVKVRIPLHLESLITGNAEYS